MVAWMAGWAGWAAPTGAPGSETAAPVLPFEPFPLPTPTQAPSSRLGADPIVTVLAQMALAHA
jgi:hypothetical protein